MMITLKKKPFLTVPLNNLEALSLATQTITIYCGLFYILDISTTTVNSDSSTSTSNTIGSNNQ